MKPELLAPASNQATLKAAVENGADAVYLGVQEFNARRRADNFEVKDLKDIVKYTHKNGVKTFVVLNILIKNAELNRFLDTVHKIYSAGVDAVIVQSIPIANFIKENFPEMEVHLSTQATVTNSEFKDILNVDRVVMPREQSLDQIKKFMKNTEIPVEVFVHGALCFAYSGQCLFSSFVSGNRSANRGMCSQPCRMIYNKKYPLSMKDLCVVDRIPELIEAKITSFKIEGRLRSASYVAAATRLYRKAIDSYYEGNFKVDLELFEDLKLAFNRDFTEGYMFESTDLRSKDNSSNQGIYMGVVLPNQKIRLETKISVGDGVAIWRDDASNGGVITTIERLGKKVTKANKGDKVILNLKLERRDKLYKTSSVIRKTYEKLIHNKEIKTIPRKPVKVSLPEFKSEIPEKQLLVKVYTLAQAEQVAEEGADIIFYSIFANDFPSVWKKPGKLYGTVPRLLNDEDIPRVLERVKNMDGLMIGDLGLIEKLKDKDLYLDYSANIFNDLDLDFVKKHGATPIISPELSLSEIAEFKNKNFPVLIHGDIIIMNTKFPLEDKKLVDQKEFKFRVISGFRIKQILNSKTLGMFNNVSEVQEIGIKRFYLDLRKTPRRLTSIYQKIITGEEMKSKLEKGHTTGHFYRATE
jgi:collagenase-like PrtC family protease